MALNYGKYGIFLTKGNCRIYILRIQAAIVTPEEKRASSLDLNLEPGEFL